MNHSHNALIRHCEVFDATAATAVAIEGRCRSWTNGPESDSDAHFTKASAALLLSLGAD